LGIKIDLKREKIISRMKSGTQKAQKAIDTAVIADSNFYCPQDTGNLQNSVILGSKIGSGELEWKAEYAKKLYYGEGYNFSKDRNPNARAKWFEAAKAAMKSNWLNIAKAAFRKG
jgi:hypothetical protein